MKLFAKSVTLITTTLLISACASSSSVPPAPSTSSLPEIPSSPSLKKSETPKTLPAPVATPAIPKERPEAPVASELPPITDAQRATELWKKIQDFKSWENPPGFEGLLESDTVHGDYVRFYANGIALSDIKNLPNGSIVVKEGFADDEGDLNAITVMEKIDGFSENSGDWFFSRYDIVGKASKVNSNSCIRCHKKADGGDFSFAND